jgi:hypothetical protein
VIPVEPTREQKRRAKDLAQKVWRAPAPPPSKPGDAGKAEAEKRFGRG